MLRNIKTQQEWLSEIQELIASIRNWNIWKQEPLAIMRSQSGSFESGSLALYAYSRYVRRFTILICDVLSKAPETDDRFWRLAINLYDEFGGAKGFVEAHGKLIEEACLRPSVIPQATWDDCAIEMDHVENEMLRDFKSLPWPLNLFALGPGTESISDLFLDPIEAWSSNPLKLLPRVQEYFEVHRPSIEYEHQMEISRVLSEELGTLSRETAHSLFSEGQHIAERIAMRHFQATCLCWRLSNSSGIINQHSAQCKE